MRAGNLLNTDRFAGHNVCGVIVAAIWILWSVSLKPSDGSGDVQKCSSVAAAGGPILHLEQLNYLELDHLK